MAVQHSALPVPSSPLRWFPEFWELGRKRIRPQARLMGLSLLVGLIAGIGAVVFFTACQLVFHYTLDAWVGYHPVTPGGEPPVPSVKALAMILTIGTRVRMYPP